MNSETWCRLSIYAVGVLSMAFGAFTAHHEWRRSHIRRMPIGFTVAKDGTGDFSDVSAAVAASPIFSETKFTIHVKEGEYWEKVTVGEGLTNIFFVGDGSDRTIISFNRSVSEGWAAQETATVEVKGDGFEARDISFKNTADPSKGLGLAFSNNAHNSALYRCNFFGYQGTLNAGRRSQFYRECGIWGVVDIIFGGAKAEFQNCSLIARKPFSGDAVVFTSHSGTEPTTSGFLFQNCTFSGESDSVPISSAYLGRQGKLQSNVILYKSYIGKLVNPVGWLQRPNTSALETPIFREYRNRGPRASTKKRIKSPAFREITTASEAAKFNGVLFVQGEAWLGSGSVPFNSTFT